MAAGIAHYSVPLGRHLILGGWRMAELGQQAFRALENPLLVAVQWGFAQNPPH